MNATVTLPLSEIDTLRDNLKKTQETLLEVRGKVSSMHVEVKESKYGTTYQRYAYGGGGREEPGAIRMGCKSQVKTMIMKHIPISKRRKLYLHIAEEFGSNKDNRKGICHYLAKAAGIDKFSGGWGWHACKAFYEISLFAFLTDNYDNYMGDNGNDKFFNMYSDGGTHNDLRATIALFCYYMTK